jgi:Flp pilus assembly CpaF family ATPase
VRTQSDLDRYVRTGLLYALDAFSEVSERIVLLEDALSASADANKQVLREGC